MKLCEENNYAHHIFGLARSMQRYVDAKFIEFGVTGHQARILHFIENKSKDGIVYQKDIEVEFNIRRSSVTSVLQNLELAGLISRDSCKGDARSKHLILTEKGKEINKLGRDIIMTAENVIKESFTKEELDIFIMYCDRLKEKYEKNGEKND